MAVETALAADFALLIITATVLGFLAKKTNQPTIIAYIFTGLLLGPVGADAIAETEFTGLLSELGLVFLLFLIGLEIELEEVREILKPITLIGGLQIIFTFLAGFLISLILGFGTVESLFIGAAVMFSSTALVVKLLSDKDESSTLPGRLDVGILLVQDIVVVLLLALIATGIGDPYSLAVKFAEVLGLITVISIVSLISAKYILPTLFKRVESDPHALFIHGVAWAFMFITAAQELNISTEIGAFVAGLGLAQLPYSSELQERVRPLTDLFMAVFFINFGLNIVPGQLSAVFAEAIIAAALLIVAKFVIFFVLIDQSKFTPETSFIASINMTQISEFGLILGSLALTQGYIGEEVVGFLSIIAILTMGTSSYLLRFNQRIYQKAKPYLEYFESEEKSDVEVRKLEDHAVIVGFDETMRNLVPVLRREFGQVVVVDNDPGKTKELSEMKVDYIYGDFLHGEIRKSSGIERAEIIVSGAPGFRLNKKIAEETSNDITTFLKAEDFENAAELYEMGTHYVIIENMIAADQISDYIELLLEEKDLFLEEIESDLEKIYWGGRDG